MKRFILFFALFYTVASHSLAACYTPEQYRAEQALRYHTKLMVIGLYCEKILHQDTYAAYQEFTKRNEKIINAQENRLVSYFKTAKVASAEKSLHSLRTDLANKTSIQASASLYPFCMKYSASLQKARSMEPDQFRKWINSISTEKSFTTTHPVCADKDSK